MADDNVFSRLGRARDAFFDPNAIKAAVKEVANKERGVAGQVAGRVSRAAVSYARSRRRRK